MTIIIHFSSALVIIMSFLQVVYPTEESLHCMSYLYLKHRLHTALKEDFILSGMSLMYNLGPNTESWGTHEIIEKINLTDH